MLDASFHHRLQRPNSSMSQYRTIHHMSAVSLNINAGVDISTATVLIISGTCFAKVHRGETNITRKASFLRHFYANGHYLKRRFSSSGKQYLTKFFIDYFISKVYVF